MKPLKYSGQLMGAGTGTGTGTHTWMYSNQATHCPFWFEQKGRHTDTKAKTNTQLMMMR